MRIGLLNRSDLNGGAAVAAMRLFGKLKEINVDVKYLVGIKHSDNNSTLLHYLSDFYTKFRKYFEDLLLNKRNGDFPFSINITFFPIKLLLNYHKIDLVHLHWIGAGFISFKSLKRIRKPIIWTMHDSWAFTGGCHIPHSCTLFSSECGKCPELNSDKEFDYSRFLLTRKPALG